MARMKLKVIDGTRDGRATSLCWSCRQATVIRGSALKEEMVRCNYVDGPVPFKVTECNQYDDRSKPTLRAMQAIAWELATEKGGRRIGFLSPREMQDRIEKKELIERRGPIVLPDGTTEWMD